MSPTEILATFEDGEMDEEIVKPEVDEGKEEHEEELPADEEPEEEIEVAEEEPPLEEEPQEPDWNAQAEEQGWRPKEEFTGDPNDWVDPKEYVQRWKILGPAREQNKQLREELQNLKSTVSREMRTFQKDKAERDAEENKAQLSAWEGRRKEAVEAGDGDAFDVADREVDRLRGLSHGEQPPLQKHEVPADIQAAADDFKARNEWFSTDHKLTNAANAYIGGQVNEIESQGGVVSEAKFKEILSEVEDHFSPTKRTETPAPPRRPKAAAVAEVQRSSPTAKSRAKTFNDLPAEDKAVFNAQAKEGIWKNNSKDRAQFARDIFSEDGRVQGKDNTYIMQIGD